MQISKEQKQVLIDWVELTPITFLRMGSMKKDTHHCLKSLLFSNDRGWIWFLRFVTSALSLNPKHFRTQKCFFELFWWFQNMFIIETRQSPQMSIFFSIPFGSESNWLKTYFFQFNFLCLLNWNMSVWHQTSFDQNHRCFLASQAVQNQIHYKNCQKMAILPR